jgi:hypothetical protein
MYLSFYTGYLVKKASVAVPDRMFLDLPDPHPLVRGADPEADPSNTLKKK